MNKIVSRPVIAQLAKRLRRRGKKIVFTNGTFDILHLGHVTYLERARRMGDLLIVGVNTDRSVRSYKDPNRPVNSQSDRIRVLSALACVDYAVLFDEPTPLRLICSIKPHILVKGADWKKREIAGAKEVESWRGRVRRLPLLRNRSTTRTLRRLGVL